MNDTGKTKWSVLVGRTDMWRKHSWLIIVRLQSCCKVSVPVCDQEKQKGVSVIHFGATACRKPFQSIIVPKQTAVFTFKKHSRPKVPQWCSAAPLKHWGDLNLTLLDWKSIMKWSEGWSLMFALFIVKVIFTVLLL